MIKAFLQNLKSDLLLSCQLIGILLEDFRAHPPIIIYQMGKVGSSTVYSSLKHAKLSNPVYHVHFLSLDGINCTRSYLNSLNIQMPSHLKISRALRYRIAGNGSRPIAIITLVRDPIARNVSSFFQNIRLKDKLFADGGKLNRRAISEYFEKHFEAFDESSDYCCSWFDREFKTFLGIDVYEYGFNQNDGFSIIEKNGVRVLILRMEDLNSIFSRSIADFLKLNDKSVQLCNTNIGSQKIYSNDYREIVSSLKLKKTTCEKIYSSKYFTHFYNEKMKRQFIEKWVS